MTCYIPRWFTRPQAAAHPSTNRVLCRLTSLIKPTPLTTTVHCAATLVLLSEATALWRSTNILLQESLANAKVSARQYWSSCSVSSGVEHRLIARKLNGRKFLHSIWLADLASLKWLMLCTLVWHWQKTVAEQAAQLLLRRSRLYGIVWNSCPVF